MVTLIISWMHVSYISIRAVSSYLSWWYWMGTSKWGRCFKVQKSDLLLFSGQFLAAALANLNWNAGSISLPISWAHHCCKINFVYTTACIRQYQFPNTGLQSITCIYWRQRCTVYIQLSASHFRICRRHKNKNARKENKYYLELNKFNRWGLNFGDFSWMVTDFCKNFWYASLFHCPPPLIQVRLYGSCTYLIKYLFTQQVSMQSSSIKNRARCVYIYTYIL